MKSLTFFNPKAGCVAELVLTGPGHISIGGNGYFPTRGDADLHIKHPAIPADSMTIREANALAIGMAVLFALEVGRLPSPDYGNVSATDLMRRI